MFKTINIQYIVGLTLLFLMPIIFAYAAESPQICQRYIGSHPTSFGIQYYKVAPILGGQPTIRNIRYSSDYDYKPVWVPLGLDGPKKSALFQFNYVTGGVYTEREQAHGQLKDSMIILISGLSYYRPEYSLGPESGFSPVGAPLTWPDYRVGPIEFSSFHKIDVVLREGESAMLYNDLFAEMNPDGSMKALLSCSQKDELLPSSTPICDLRELVEGWETSTTFFRERLLQIDAIRSRRDEFIECISREGQK